MVRSFQIKVPASSANIGPGFDVLGIALTLYLELHVVIDPSKANDDPNNCKITYEGQGVEDVPLSSDENLVTRVALYVLRCNGLRSFPTGTHVHAINPIPLGRGLGSSGAAVAAGVILGSEIGNLKFSKQRILDYCLMVERHPDNIAAAIMGGFVGSYLRELSAADLERVEIPLAEVLPSPAGGKDTGLSPPEPPYHIGSHISFGWAKEIKAITVIPDFEVSTATARSVLPEAYTKKDAIFNLQRLSVLTTALTRSPPDPELIFAAMQDKMHQPYRKVLVPGMNDILSSMSPRTHPGLLGICLSGAGPTMLALATDNFEEIAQEMLSRFEKHQIKATWKLLEPAFEGSTVVESK